MGVEVGVGVDVAVGGVVGTTLEVAVGVLVAVGRLATGRAWWATIATRALTFAIQYGSNDATRPSSDACWMC